MLNKPLFLFLKGNEDLRMEILVSEMPWMLEKFQMGSARACVIWWHVMKLHPCDGKLKTEKIEQITIQNQITWIQQAFSACGIKKILAYWKVLIL